MVVESEVRLLISVTEAASLLGIGRNLAYDLVHEGRLPSLRLGSRILIPRTELEHWIADEVVVAAPMSRGVELASKAPPH